MRTCTGMFTLGIQWKPFPVVQCYRFSHRVGFQANMGEKITVYRVPRPAILDKNARNDSLSCAVTGNFGQKCPRPILAIYHLVPGKYYLVL